MNAKGDLRGRPGCWQKITRDLWPARHLVMDTGLSVALQYFQFKPPMFVDYVWGRQIGTSTRSTRDVDINNCSGSTLTV